MEHIENGWFHERNDLWQGQRFSLQVDEILHHSKSLYQDILIIKTKTHGRVLILDGIIQCTEHDEFAYQEMIAFLPICAHPHPKRVLIIGGGDGGVAREVAKHPCVEHVTQVEIDEGVIAASKQFLPFMSCGFASPKLDLQICDGFEFMRMHTNTYDIIITDSSDPIGPAVSLFKETYFALVKSALKENGVMCSQGGAPWACMRQVSDTMDSCRKHFPNVSYAMASVPTYPTGQIGFIIASKDPNNDLTQTKCFDDDDGNIALRYYSKAIHQASFILPRFIKEQLTATYPAAAAESNTI